MNVLEAIDITTAQDASQATGRRWANRLSNAFAPNPIGGEAVHAFQMAIELSRSSSWNEIAPCLPSFATILAGKVAVRLETADPVSGVRLYGASNDILESAREADLPESAVRYLNTRWNDCTLTTLDVVREQRDDSSGREVVVWPPEITVVPNQ